MCASWQKNGLHMLIESLGPWGQPQHGVQGAYNAPGSEALAYQCSVNVGYSVIPSSTTSSGKKIERGPEYYYRMLAYKAPSGAGLFVTDAKGKSVRVDKSAAPIVRQGNLDYRAVLKYMRTRTLLKGDAGVMWESRDKKTNVLYSFKEQSISVANGKKVYNQSTGTNVEIVDNKFIANAYNTYIIK